MKHKFVGITETITTTYEYSNICVCVFFVAGLFAFCFLFLMAWIEYRNNVTFGMKHYYNRIKPYYSWFLVSPVWIVLITYVVIIM